MVRESLGDTSGMGKIRTVSTETARYNEIQTQVRRQGLSVTGTERVELEEETVEEV